jgi:hypothetical protein
MSDLKVLAHKADTQSGSRYWYEVVGDLDSCGHRHESRAEAGACKRALECDHAGDWMTVTYDRAAEHGFSGPVLDVKCDKCGRSGSFLVTPDSVNWA